MIRGGKVGDRTVRYDDRGSLPVPVQDGCAAGDGETSVTRRLLVGLLWGVSGGLIGLGLIALWSIGFFVLLAGVGLGIYLVGRLGFDGIWAAVSGFGLVPAGVLLYDIHSASPSCGGASLGPEQTGSVSCSTVPNSYAVMAAFFGCVALLGVGAQLLRQRRVH